jgi:hypothetical protein
LDDEHQLNTRLLIRIESSAVGSGSINDTNSLDIQTESSAVPVSMMWGERILHEHLLLASIQFETLRPEQIAGASPVRLCALRCIARLDSSDRPCKRPLTTWTGMVPQKCSGQMFFNPAIADAFEVGARATEFEESRPSK